MKRERRRWTRGTPEVRRGEILDAAQALIITVGYDTMTMSQVADRAGLGKGTVYLYFDSKQQLLEGLQARYWSRRADVARVALARRASSWRLRLDRLVDDLIAYAVREDALFHALFLQVPGIDVEPIADVSGVIEAILRGGQEAGEFHLVDLDMTARFLASAYHGTGISIIHAPTSTRRQRVRLFKELLHRVVGAA